MTVRTQEATTPIAGWNEAPSIVPSFLLQESLDFLLLETGGKIILDQTLNPTVRTEVI